MVQADDMDEARQRVALTLLERPDKAAMVAAARNPAALMRGMVRMELRRMQKEEAILYYRRKHAMTRRQTRPDETAVYNELFERLKASCTPGELVFLLECVGVQVAGRRTKNAEWQMRSRIKRKLEQVLNGAHSA